MRSSVQRKTDRDFGKFRNYRQTNFMLFHIHKCRRFRKSHQKSELELGMPAEWQHSSASLWNVCKKTKNFKSAENQRNAILIFITFRNHRPTIFMLFHIYKCRRFRKSHQKSEPELGIPAEWQHSKVSLRNVTQKRKTSKTPKLNEMLHLFLWLSGITGQQFLCYFTSTSIADSENHIKKVNRNLECQQNDNTPRPVCETFVKKRKTSKMSKINEMRYLFLWLSEIIGQRFLCYFTSAIIADSENHIKKVNRNLEYKQNDNIPRSVCETSVKKEKLQKRRENQLSAVFIFMTPESSEKSVKGVPLDEHFSCLRTFVRL